RVRREHRRFEVSTQYAPGAAGILCSAGQKRRSIEASSKRGFVRSIARFAAVLLTLPVLAFAQRRTASQTSTRSATMPASQISVMPDVSAAFDSVALTGVRWRELGPYRGGRSVAVGGGIARPNE